MAIYSLVKFDGFSDRQWILYRHPVTAINSNSKLIVSYNQLGIVAYRGRVEKVFDSGTYEVNGDNFSFIPGVGMRSREGEAFDVEVYFFNKDQKLDMLWGTKDPIEVLDFNTSNNVRVRARGKYRLNIINFKFLIEKLLLKATKNNLLEYEKLAFYLKNEIVGEVKEALEDFLLTNKTALLNISSYNKDLEKLCLPILQENFKNYGLKIDNFNIESINVFDQDLYKLKEESTIKVEEVKVEEKKVDTFTKSTVDFGKSTTFASYKEKVNENKKQAECPKCGKFSDSNAYCPYCGSPMKLRCVLCNYELSKEDDYCPKCNTKVNR